MAKYPKLYQSVVGRCGSKVPMIVEFTGLKRGKVIDPGDTSNKKGYTYSTWVKNTDTEYWVEV